MSALITFHKPSCSFPAVVSELGLDTEKLVGDFAHLLPRDVCENMICGRKMQGNQSSTVLGH